MTKQHPIDRVLQLLEQRGISETQFLKDCGLAPAIFRNQRDKAGDERANALSLPTLRVMADKLGTTLADLLGLQGAAAASVVPAELDTSISLVPLDKLRASLLNPRKAFDAAALEELADSILAQGLLQNLVVRPANAEGIHEIIAGERRFRALEILTRRQPGMSIPANFLVPVKIQSVDDAQHMALALLENLQRRDMDPLDEANGFLQLQQLDPKAWSARKIAAAVGMSDRYVQGRIALVTKLPDEAREALAKGDITVSQARVILQASDKDDAEALLNMAKGSEYRGPATVQQLLQHLTSDMVPIERAIFEVAKSKLATTEIEGKVYFTDRAEFSKAQKAAAQAKVKELRATGAYRFVELVDGYFDRSAYGKAAKGEKQGVVIHLDYRDEYKLIGGLTKSPGQRDAETKKEDPAETARKQKETAAVEKMQRGVNKALSASPPLTVRLWLFDVLQPESGNFVECAYNAGSHLARHMGLGAMVESGTIKAGNEAKLWDRLIALKPAELLEAAAIVLLANDFEPLDHYENRITATGAVALQACGIEPPAHLLPSQGELEPAILKAAAKGRAA